MLTVIYAAGLDEGLISTTVAQESFIHEFGLNASYLDTSQQANRLSNITSMVHIGSIPGALIAFLLCEHIGILWSMRQLCLLWLIGVVIVITSSGSIGQIYAGRFIMGLGIGQAGVISPTYLAEIAPAHARGMLVSLFGMSEYIGIRVGYFSSWGAALHISDSTARQWTVPQSIQIIVAGGLGLSSFLCEESPRRLCKAGKSDQARRALGRLWGLPVDHEDISSEIASIYSQLEAFQESSIYKSWVSSLKELLAVRTNQKRVLFVFSEQILSQWSGANSITTYAPELFSLLGLTGQSEKLFVTAIFGAVKFLASFFCAILLIDHVGRKSSLISGIIIQLIALLRHAMANRAAIAAIVFMYFVGIGWAIGWNSIQYLINAEIFPLHLRATGSSLLMCFHYTNRYGLSKAVPSMLLDSALQPKGTFWIFSTVTIFGLGWAWFLLPETAGRTLEETNDLFE
ncbi:uncharacterized protein N7473_006954 [Penicillium subrubescens]|uniref:uncharacterized protein n=1 Tax=Penicillium subrubescens TaxID=1316194 RepID=UPI00254544D7|nr:uncharacterized protein N7473_006954 [Penicillium subrubescens]KAJ5890726.1 hypothetical protein N7473_006954 [Penicillium subrubescens]